MNSCSLRAVTMDGWGRTSGRELTAQDIADEEKRPEDELEWVNFKCGYKDFKNILRLLDFCRQLNKFAKSEDVSELILKLEKFENLVKV